MRPYTILVNRPLLPLEFMTESIHRFRQVIHKTSEIGPELVSHRLPGLSEAILHLMGVKLQILDIDNILPKEVYPGVKRAQEILPEISKLFCESHFTPPSLLAFSVQLSAYCYPLIADR